eukprot:SAG31_NODE_28531_length_408_cov_1.660194_1_plen_107_part_10
MNMNACDNGKRGNDNEDSEKESKRFRCTQSSCASAFSRRDNLIRHMRSVHCHKRYYCDVGMCDASFSDPSSLRRHILHVHNDTVNLLQCKKCEGIFSGSSSLENALT